MSFSGCQSLGLLSVSGPVNVSDSSGRGEQEAVWLELSQTLPSVLLLLADPNLCPLVAKNSNLKQLSVNSGSGFFCFLFFAEPCSMWDLGSLTRD